jgi:hypothetical protein
MPDNVTMLGWIIQMFPNAKNIHCRRDLRDGLWISWAWSGIPIA